VISARLTWDAPCGLLVLCSALLKPLSDMLAKIGKGSGVQPEVYSPLAGLLAVVVAALLFVLFRRRAARGPSPRLP